MNPKYFTLLCKVDTGLLKYSNIFVDDELPECVTVIKADLARALTILKGMDF